MEASIFFRGRKKAAAKNLASKFIIIKNYTGKSVVGGCSVFTGAT